jgi:hypothetical protein
MHFSDVSMYQDWEAWPYAWSRFVSAIMLPLLSLSRAAPLATSTAALMTASRSVSTRGVTVRWPDGVIVRRGSLATTTRTACR